MTVLHGIDQESPFIIHYESYPEQGGGEAAGEGTSGKEGIDKMRSLDYTQRVALTQGDRYD
jgi:hypothetical protein